MYKKIIYIMFIPCKARIITYYLIIRYEGSIDQRKDNNENFMSNKNKITLTYLNKLISNNNGNLDVK